MGWNSCFSSAICRRNTFILQCDLVKKVVSMLLLLWLTWLLICCFVTNLRDSMNMVESPKLQLMHPCNHQWIYFLLGTLHIHANFFAIFKSKFWLIFNLFTRPDITCFPCHMNSFPMSMYCLGVLVSFHVRVAIYSSVSRGNILFSVQMKVDDYWKQFFIS
jgi:hypothetical protein